MALFCSHHGWIKVKLESNFFCPGSWHKLFNRGPKKSKASWTKVTIPTCSHHGYYKLLQKFLFHHLGSVCERVVYARVHRPLYTIFLRPTSWDTNFCWSNMGYLLEMIPRNWLKPLSKSLNAYFWPDSTVLRHTWRSKKWGHIIT